MDDALSRKEKAHSDVTVEDGSKEEPINKNGTKGQMSAHLSQTPMVCVHVPTTHVPTYGTGMH